MISEKLLRKVVREVRKAHPDVLGVGIGLRRKSGRIKREFVLKVYVTKKLKKLKKGKKLLKHWLVSIGKGTKRIQLHLPTDVEMPMTVNTTGMIA